MTKNDFAFGKENFILIAVSVVIITAGFLLMQGGGVLQDGAFNPEIFNLRRIVVAPVITLIGFGLMIFAILRNSKEKKNNA
jgi:hypothetical protein